MDDNSRKIVTILEIIAVVNEIKIQTEFQSNENYRGASTFLREKYATNTQTLNNIISFIAFRTERGGFYTNTIGCVVWFSLYFFVQLY